jgi:hypothetical protein
MSTNMVSTAPAEGLGLNKSAESPVIPTPVKIAPIPPTKLPGVISRFDPTPDELELGNEGAEDTAEDVTKEPEVEVEKKPEEVKKYTFAGKTFDTPEAALKFADDQNKIARNAQAKADKDLASVIKRLDQLEKGSVTVKDNPANLPATGNLDAETQEFWRQAHNGLLQLNTIEDPAERAKQQLIFTVAVAQKIAEDSRQALLDELGNRIKPFEERSAEEQNLTAAEGVFRAVMEEKSADGTPLYPELTREGDLENIISAWSSYERVGIPRAILYHPDHIKMIVLAHRAAHGDVKKMEKVLPSPAELNQKPKPATATAVTAGGFTPPNLKQGRGTPGMAIPGVFSKVS